MNTTRNAQISNSSPRKGLFAAFIVCLFTLSLLSPAAQAQYRASIQGVVADPSGAVIPGATLTLVNDANGAKQVRTSNAEGIFNFNALPPDTFTLTVEKDGFQKQVIAKVQVIADQSNAVNVQLVVGTASQTVSVDASLAPLLNTQSASVGGQISENQIQHMPSFGRDVFQLTQLAPGVFGDGSQGSGGGAQQLPGTQGPGGTGGSTGIFQTENGPQALANGGQYESNGISVDGISTASAVWGGTHRDHAQRGIHWRCQDPLQQLRRRGWPFQRRSNPGHFEERNQQSPRQSFLQCPPSGAECVSAL